MASFKHVNGKLMLVISAQDKRKGIEGTDGQRKLAEAAGISFNEAIRAINHGRSGQGTKARYEVTRNKAGDIWVRLTPIRTKDSMMNKTEAREVERILRAAHRVAKRAVMDAPASGLWAASGGTGRENTSLVAKFTVKRKDGTKKSGLTIPQVQKLVGIYGRFGQQLSDLQKGEALKTPNGDFITRDARTGDAGVPAGVEDRLHKCDALLDKAARVIASDAGKYPKVAAVKQKIDAAMMQIARAVNF